MDPAFHGIFGYSDWLRWAYLLDGWHNSQCCPLIGWKILAALHRTPSGDRRESGRSPPGHLRDIAENLVIWGWNWPMAEQSPGGDHQVTTGWVYNFVQGQENWPATYGSRKIGIWQKSGQNLAATTQFMFNWDLGFTSWPSVTSYRHTQRIHETKRKCTWYLVKKNNKLKTKHLTQIQRCRFPNFCSNFFYRNVSKGFFSPH